MDDPDFKIKGLDKNNNKNSVEESLTPSTAQGDLSSTSSKFGDLDPDKEISDFHRKLDSDLITSSEFDDKNAGRFRYSTVDTIESRSRKVLVSILVAVLFLLVGYLVYEEYIKEPEVVFDEPKVVPINSLPKASLSNKKCEEIFELGSSLTPKFSPSGTKSLLKMLDCLAVVGEFESYDRVLLGTKLSKNEVVSIYSKLVKYLRRWYAAPPKVGACKDWKMSSACVSQLLWYHKSRRLDLYNKYLYRLSQKKYSSSSFFPGMLTFLTAMGTTSSSGWSKKFEKSIDQLPEYLPGLKTLFGLTALDWYVFSGIDTRKLFKKMRSIKSQGAGIFGAVKGIATHLAISKGWSDSVKTLKHKKLDVVRYPSLVRMWFIGAVHQRDFAGIDQAISNLMIFNKTKLIGTVSLKNEIDLLKARLRNAELSNIEQSKALSSIKSSPASYYFLAQLHFDLNDKASWAKSYSYIQKAEEKGMLGWQFYVLKAYLELLLDKNSKAKASMDYLKRKYSGSKQAPWVAFLKAVDYMKRSKYLKSHRILKNLISKPGANIEFYELLIYSYNALSNNRDSLKVSLKLDEVKRSLDYFKSIRYMYSPFGPLVGYDSIEMAGPNL